MEYIVCETKSVTELRDEVNRLIENGWQVTGGVCVVQSQTSGMFWYYQALILDTSTEN